MITGTNRQLPSSIHAVQLTNHKPLLKLVQRRSAVGAAGSRQDPACSITAKDADDTFKLGCPCYTWHAAVLSLVVSMLHQS